MNYRQKYCGFMKKHSRGAAGENMNDLIPKLPPETYFLQLFFPPKFPCAGLGGLGITYILYKYIKYCTKYNIQKCIVYCVPP